MIINNNFKINFSNINIILDKIKKFKNRNFIENIEIIINLFSKNINNYNNLFGYHDLPNKNMKNFIIGVLSNIKDYDYLRKINVDYVGLNEILEAIKSKKKIDILLSLEDYKNEIIKIKNIFNSKYKIPNEKRLTLINNINIINDIKNGNKVLYNCNKNGTIYLIIGNIKLNNNILNENITSFLNCIYSKIKNNKNIYLKSIYIKSTMSKAFLL